MDIKSISYGTKLIYSIYIPDLSEKNLKLDIQKIVETLDEKPIPGYKKYIGLYISGDVNGVTA